MEKDHFYFLRDNHQALFTSLKHLYSHLNCREVYFNEAIYEYPCAYWSLWKSENRKIITHAPVLNFCLECYYVKQNALVIYCCNEERASKPIYHDTQWQTVICLGMMKGLRLDRSMVRSLQVRSLHTEVRSLHSKVSSLHQISYFAPYISYFAPWRKLTWKVDKRQKDKGNFIIYYTLKHLFHHW